MDGGGILAEDEGMKIDLTPEQNAAHRVSWFVRADGSDEWLPRTSHMRGRWGFDAKCSCGWESRTGGGTERSVRAMVEDHKFEVKFGLYEEEQA